MSPLNDFDAKLIAGLDGDGAGDGDAVSEHAEIGALHFGFDATAQEEDSADGLALREGHRELLLDVKGGEGFEPGE